MIEVHIANHPHWTEIMLLGELDGYELPAVRESIPDATDTSVLLLILDEVPFVDSAGLGWLLQYVRSNSTKEIVVSVDNAQLQKVLKTTGIDRIIPVQKNVGSAYRAVCELLVAGGMVGDASAVEPPTFKQII